MKFISDDIERDLIRLRHQYEQLSKENEQQRREISTLENRFHSNHSYDLLKFHQTQLEEQLAQQCRKTLELENILQQANIGKDSPLSFVFHPGFDLDQIQFDRLNHLQLSHDQLEEKYRIAQRLEEQLNELNARLQEKTDLIDKLQRDYEHEHQARLQAEKLLQNIHTPDEHSLSILSEETEKLHQTIRELNEKVERQNSNENIQVNPSLRRPFSKSFCLGIERKISENEDFINSIEKRITR